MGYPGLQDGRPPRSRAGAELPDGPVPGDMPGEEPAGYAPPPVPGADGVPWRDNGPAARPAYPGPGNGAPGNGAPGNGAPGNGGPARPGPRHGAHRARPGAGPGSAGPAPAGRPDDRSGGSGSYRAGGQHGQPGPATAAPGSTPWPAAPAAQTRSAPPSQAPAPDNGSWTPSRPVAGPQDQAWLSSPPAPGPAGRPASGRPAGPGDRTGVPPRHPGGGGRAWPPAPASTGPQAPYSTGPQAPYRPQTESPGDEPPGLAITREPPGARRAAAPRGGAPRGGARRGPIRGYPPRPGQPDPVYPPGQFSPWNRASTRAAWLGAARTGPGATDAEAEPGYSALALSDAAADLTATQTWAVIDEEPPPSPSPAPGIRRDWGSHADETGPGGQRAIDRRAAGRRPDARDAGSRTTGPRRARGAGDLAAGFGDRPGAGPGATGPRATGPGASGPGAAGPRATGPGASGLGADGPGATGPGPSGLGAARPGAARPGAVGPGAPEPGTAGGLGATASGLAGAGRHSAGAGRLDGAGRPAGGLGGSPAELDGPPAGLHGPPGRPGGPGTGIGDRTGPGGRAAGRRDAERPGPAAFGETERGRRLRRAAADEPESGDGRPATPGRRSGRRGRRHNAAMAGLLLIPVLVVALVVAGYVYFTGSKVPTAPTHSAPPSHPAAAAKSPAATLGPWKHIESRSQDPVPLTVTQLFPAKFAAAGQAGALTVSKSGSKCTHEVIGSKLAAAIRKADCTQVLRASYLSTDRKIMATVGVLNLESATEAEKAGKAAGAVEFIKQLASAHGPTRNIAKGTGIVEASVKGHYLILTWTEFANLKAPSGKKQKKKLEAFSAGLVAGTANVSLTNRMVNGHP
jgi:hypothetical protein